MMFNVYLSYQYNIYKINNINNSCNKYIDMWLDSCEVSIVKKNQILIYEQQCTPVASGGSVVESSTNGRKL